MFERAVNTLLFYSWILNDSDPWSQDLNWAYIRHSENVLDVFWTPYDVQFTLCIEGGRRHFSIDRTSILIELANFSALKKRLPAKKFTLLLLVKWHLVCNVADVSTFLYSTFAYLERFQISKLERFVKIVNCIL